MRALFDLGINRISLGCQTFDDALLKQINRRHNAGQVIDAVKVAQDVGFNNISLDFIYGLPNQSCESFLNDLKTAVSLGVQHISLYGLKIEDGCYFFRNSVAYNVNAQCSFVRILFLKPIVFLSQEKVGFSK